MRNTTGKDARRTAQHLRMRAAEHRRMAAEYKAAGMTDRVVFHARLCLALLTRAEAVLARHCAAVAA